MDKQELKNKLNDLWCELVEHEWRKPGYITMRRRRSEFDAWHFERERRYQEIKRLEGGLSEKEATEVRQQARRV